MVYNIQYHWVCGHSPSFGILNTRKLNVLETDPVFETLLTMDKVHKASDSEYCSRSWWWPTVAEVCKGTQLVTVDALRCLFVSIQSTAWTWPLTPLTSPTARLQGEVRSLLERWRSFKMSGAGMTSNRDGRRCLCDSSHILRSISSLALRQNKLHDCTTARFTFPIQFVNLNLETAAGNYIYHQP
jgi:hypothetical protein